MMVRYDPEADVLFIQFCDRLGRTRGKQLDDRRIMHFDEADEFVAFEVLFASRGVELAGLSEEQRDKICAAIQSLRVLSAV